jgi:hypothetical protein
MTKPTIAASGDCAECGHQLEVQCLHCGGYVEPLDLDAIRPALLQAKNICENGDCGYSRERGGDGLPGCPWCALTLKWKRV